MRKKVKLHKRSYTVAFFFAVSFILLVSCRRRDSDSFFGDFRDLSERAISLVYLLEETEDDDVRFALKKEIARELKESGQKKRLIVFLSSSIEEGNKYNNYFLLMLANEYIESSPDIACYYFERIVCSDYDLIVNENSVRWASLQALIKVQDVPERLINYYSLLIKEFPDDGSLSYNLFMLARSYEKLGEWKASIQTYEKFLSLKDFDVVVPGIPDSFTYAKKIVDYSSSSKNWTVESLDELVGIIKYAVRDREYGVLERYRSKVNFFAMSWKEEMTDHYSETSYTIYNLMYSDNVQIASTVDASSTPYEAYLRTSGWSHYAKTWYFYLKKINFPADPSIHGRWEWAGIYYGEKL